MGHISDSLDKNIKRSVEQINRYNADLALCQQQMTEANKAISLFKKSSADLKAYISEITGVFQGDAADAFTMNMADYNESIEKMIPVMESKVKALNDQIKSLESQKRWCEYWTATRLGILNGFRFLHL